MAWAGPAQPLSTAEAAANCDPDYGWINGPEGTNKCYMILRVNREHSLTIVNCCDE